MPSINHQALTGAELHVSKIDATTGTELTTPSLAILDARYAAAGASTYTPVTSETPTGSIDGTNTTFTLAFTPTAGSTRLFLNGLRQKPGAGNSYTQVGTTITLSEAPQAGDELLVDYFR